MAAGSIVVSLLMSTGSFETDTARAGKSLKALQKSAEDIGRKIGLAFTGLAFGLGYLVKNTINAADHLNDLSKSTGVSVETLGGIGFAASQAGSSLDGAATAIGRLNQTLAKAAAGNKEAGDSLRALGVNAIDPLTGKTTAVDAALVQLANTFERSADSPEKFRAAAGALGKQYQELVPLLADGGQALLENIAYYQRYGGITTETARKADQFNDTLGKLSLLAGSFGKILTAELLTPLQGIANAFLQSKEKGDGFRTTAVGIKDALVGVASLAAFVVQSLSAMSSRLDGLIQRGQAIAAAAAKAREKNPLDVFGTGFVFRNNGLGTQFDIISGQVAADVAVAQKTYDDFVARLKTDTPTPAKPALPRIPGIPDASRASAAAAAAEAELKRRLDGLLRSIKAASDEQQGVLAFQNRFLEGEYQDGVTSLANFFADQSRIRQRALQVQLDEQDAIIAAEAKFARDSKNPANRIDAQNKIDQARQTKTQLTIQAGQEEQLALQQNARDVRALAKEFEGVNVQVLDLRENFAAAAGIRFDLQFDALSKTFTANGNQAGLDAIETLRAATVAQAEFQKAALDSGRALESLAHLEDRIALAQQTGALSSIDALIKLGEVRRAQIPILGAEVAAQEAIAKASGNRTLIANAEAAKLALDKLKAAADPLAESLNRAFGDEFNDALGDFVTGTKSASDAFKSFADSVLKDILRMGSKSITESIFGGSGGVGGFISDLFKSGGARNIFGAGPNTGAGEVGGVPQNAIADLFKDTGATAARSAETAAISANTAALTALGTAAASATAALSAISATGSETGSGISAVLTDVFKDSTAARSAETDAISTSTAAMTALATVASSNVATMTDLGSAATAVASALVTLSTLSTTTGTATKAASSFNWEDIVSWFSSLGTRAAGGPVMHSRTYLVGERGPELFVPERSGSIVPHHRLQDLPAQLLKTGRHDVLAPRHDDIVLNDKLKEVWKISEVLRTSEKDREIWREKLGRSFGGARAQGGPVSKSKTYMVGERGPELFIPKQSGSIVPNHRLKKIEEDEEVLKLRTSRPRALEKLVSRLGPFGGARAEGGPVTPSKVYVVGEKSPEWFVPAALKAQDVFRQDSAKRQAEQISYTRNVPLKSPGLVSSLGRAPSVPVELKFNDLEVRVEEGREKLIPPRLFGGARAGPVVYTAGESEPVLIPQQIPQQLGVPTFKDWSVDALKGPTDVLAARSVAPQLVPSKMAAELGKMEMVGLKGSELLVERNSENEKLRETNNSILRTFRSEQKVREVWRENLSWPGSFEGAKDGSVVSNETSIVGEKGPELFVSKQDHLKEVLRSNDAMSLMRSDAIVTNNLREVMATTDVLRERENRLERLYQPLQPHIKGPLPSGASTSSKAETGWFVSKVPKASEVLKTSSLTQIVGAQGPALFAPERSGRIVTNHRLQTEEVLKARTTAPVLDERLGNLVSRLGGVLDDARTAGGPITASNQKDSVSTVTAGQVKHAEQIIISAKSIVPRLKTDEAWRDELVALLGRFGGSRVTGGPVAASKPYLVGGRELFVAAGENSVVSNTIQSNLSMPKWFDDLLVSWGGARAVGGPVTMNKAYMVGERGPEMFVPGQNGTVTPNNRLGGTTKNINVNVSMPQGANRETGAQFGAAIARRLAIEDSRNN